MTRNSLFLIFPWIHVPHHASHILSLVARRISSEWIAKYRHPLYSLETFVERDRFKDTCYKAANRIFVGSTTGRGRNSVRGDGYPLVHDFREKLCKENNEL